MGWFSILAIYLLFWTLSAFLMLPFEAKTHEEAGIPLIPGQAESAPANFRPGRLTLRTTILSAILCGLFVANYQYGWVTAKDINLFGELTEWDDAETTAAD